MNARVTLLLLAVVASGSGCVGRVDGRGEEFVRQFVGSVVDDSDFYRSHSDPRGREWTEAARRFVTKEFRIVGRDGFFLYSDSFEYHVRFANGCSGTLYVSASQDPWLAYLVAGWEQEHEAKARPDSR